jgi:hypothetical protein
LDQSQEYERASVEIKPHTARAFTQDTSNHLTINHGSDNLPPGTSTSQLDEYNTHPRIVVGQNNKPEVNTIKRVVEEDCMTENEEYVDHTVPEQEPGHHHQEDRLPYMYEKPDLVGILDQDQQNAQKRDTPADEAHYMVRDDAVHEFAKYETTFNEAPQQTVTIDVKIELTHHGAEYNTTNMDTKYETSQQDVTKTCSEMADNAHLQVRNSEAHHGVGDNAMHMD